LGVGFEEVEPHPKFGYIATGVFSPVLAKHSKHFSLEDALSIGVDRMQRTFEPMRKQVEVWQSSELTDVTANPGSLGALHRVPADFAS